MPHLNSLDSRSEKLIAATIHYHKSLSLNMNALLEELLRDNLEHHATIDRLEDSIARNLETIDSIQEELESEQTAHTATKQQLKQLQSSNYFKGSKLS